MSEDRGPEVRSTGPDCRRKPEARSPACKDHPAHLPAHVRKFGTCTADLELLADWLRECNVTTVAMESTGVYWVPLFESRLRPMPTLYSVS
jgi:hypothetical protein